MLLPKVGGRGEGVGEEREVGQRAMVEMQNEENGYVLLLENLPSRTQGKKEAGKAGV